MIILANFKSRNFVSLPHRGAGEKLFGPCHFAARTRLKQLISRWGAMMTLSKRWNQLLQMSRRAIYTKNLTRSDGGNDNDSLG